MGVQVANNATSTLAGSLTNVATSMSVQAGHGARFPAASVVSGNYFYVTLISAANAIEIVKVTDRTTDTFTIVRARDGTTAIAFSANDRVELRPVAALFNELPNRLLVNSDLTDNTIDTVKLKTIAGLSPGTYGGLGAHLIATVNAKGQVTGLSADTGFVQQDVFAYTGSPVTWTKPATGSMVLIQIWGGGGGGGRAAAGNGGAGGGGGAYTEVLLPLTSLGATETATVGIGGAGATADNTSGVDGGNSTFTVSGKTMTAFGGTKGNSGSAGGNGASFFSKTGGGVGGASTPTAIVDIIRVWDGAGGGAGSAGNSTVACTGGNAIWGGAGGGGAADNTDAGSQCVGGTSVFGGNGGRGSVDIGGTPINSASGATPAGGGGGSEAQNAGSGGAGRIVVTVF